MIRQEHADVLDRRRTELIGAFIDRVDHKPQTALPHQTCNLSGVQSRHDLHHEAQAAAAPPLPHGYEHGQHRTFALAFGKLQRKIREARRFAAAWLAGDDYAMFRFQQFEKISLSCRTFTVPIFCVVIVVKRLFVTVFLKVGILFLLVIIARTLRVLGVVIKPTILVIKRLYGFGAVELVDIVL